MEKNSNAITLIGMPGCGKSTIGKMLAEKLGWDFVDLDSLIKETTGKNHAEVLAESGDQEFIKLEGELALGINFNKLIFAPGGSIIYSPEAMDKLKKETGIFYLYLPIEEIKSRLRDSLWSRGVVGLKNKGPENLFEERDILYRKYAEKIIDCGGLSKKEILKIITG